MAAIGPVEIKIIPPDEFKELIRKLPDNFAARLEECERALEELCERGGIEFDKPEPQSQTQSRSRERVVRNVKDKYQDPSRQHE